jgi:methylase of polypeptide subunit release factors
MTSREERKQEEAERRRESPTDYILATGEAAASRLEMLEEIFGPHSRQLLEKAELSNGLRVADIGCGTGLVSLWIATQLGLREGLWVST